MRRTKPTILRFWYCVIWVYDENEIETVLKTVEKVPENMAYILENTPYGNEEEVRRLLYALVKNNSEIYGSTIAFEPYAFRNDTRDFGVYCYKNKDSVDFMLMAEEGSVTRSGTGIKSRKCCSTLFGLNRISMKVRGI